MKVFKRTKSIKKIQQEIEYQRRAADAGLAPKIVSSWKIDSVSFAVLQQQFNQD